MSGKETKCAVNRIKCHDLVKGKSGVARQPQLSETAEIVGRDFKVLWPRVWRLNAMWALGPRGILSPRDNGTLHRSSALIVEFPRGERESGLGFQAEKNRSWIETRRCRRPLDKMNVETGYTPLPLLLFLFFFFHSASFHSPTFIVSIRTNFNAPRNFRRRTTICEIVGKRDKHPSPGLETFSLFVFFFFFVLIEFEIEFGMLGLGNGMVIRCDCQGDVCTL